MPAQAVLNATPEIGGSLGDDPKPQIREPGTPARASKPRPGEGVTMKSLVGCSCAALFVGLAAMPVAFAALPAMSAAQAPDTATATASLAGSESSVLQYDLSGPRLGATFAPEGSVRSQFGWHFEHQAAPRARGPWLVVETVLLAGGVEQRRFIPGGTLVFGLRLPNGYEFGVGPNVTLGGPRFLNSSVVIAAGRTFRIDGIQIPLNLALATNRDGQRLSVVTGWAIRESRDAAAVEPAPRRRSLW